MTQEEPTSTIEQQTTERPSKQLDVEPSVYIDDGGARFVLEKMRRSRQRIADLLFKGGSLRCWD